jgi:hypothetical protein
MEWFSALEWFNKIFWVIAIIGSLFFVVMLLVTFIGGSADFEMDGEFDIDGSGFHFFTIKNLIAFFTLFGWTGIAAIDAGLSKAMVIFVASISGVIMMTIMATMFYFISKLSDSGTLNMKNALGGIGEVYLTIGANRSSIGKINIRIQGALREVEALTDEQEDLKQGMVVQVEHIETNGIVIVNKIKK